MDERLYQALSIAPETGALIVGGAVALRPLTSCDEIASLPGVERVPHDEGADWYWAGDIQSPLGTVKLLCGCRDSRLDEVQLSVGGTSQLASIELNRQILEASLGPPSESSSVAIWNFPWGSASANYHREGGYPMIQVVYVEPDETQPGHSSPHWWPVDESDES